MPLIPPAVPPVTPKEGLVITHSSTLRAGKYLIPETQGLRKANDETVPTFPHAAITVRGNNLVVDFAGVTLEGTQESVDPDKRQGLGLEVIGSNITIKNAKIRGYMVGLLAQRCSGLKLIDCDFSYNWKQHLHSTVEKEDESDWQSYHHNEAGEWLRYGAGAYLADCSDFEVRGTRVHGGQCGLLLTRCTHGKVWNSDFSFNSGLGIGMYRSSDNVVMHNRADWNVRGFSYGVYNRGQDSAGILVFEQCNRNIFAYNSVTHGGDGFFLWAGQSTMDTGQGGCNDNLVFGNDFSHAPTNGIESTFSRNAFVGNAVYECWHGVWGGYSHDTKIIGNKFGFNGQTVSIEHGQDNVIALNEFNRDASGIGLWQDPIQDSNWGYPKHRDTASHSYVIRGNRFIDLPGSAIDLRNTTDSLIDVNYFAVLPTALRLRKSSHTLLSSNHFINVLQPVRSDSDGAGNLLEVDPAQVMQLEDGAKISPPTIDGAGRPVDSRGTSLDEYLERFQPIEGFRPSERASAIRAATEGEYEKFLVPPLKGGVRPFLAAHSLRGQRYILVDDWGPYDFLRPLLWPRGDTPAKPGVQRFELLGPSGKWRVASIKGAAELSSKSGVIPGELEARFNPSQAGTTEILLEYVGADTVDEKGVATPAGKPIRFGFSRFYAPIAWDVKFYSWDKASDPRTAPAAFSKKLHGPALAHVQKDRLDYAGYGAFEKGVPGTYFATEADGEVTLPVGEYVVELTTDDGARLSIDGKRVIDEWHYQGPTSYTAKLSGGNHRLHVDHFQIDGYSALKVVVKPK